ncbi:COMM domain-containing protein 8-like [Nasonia vitripennis]|uniref:COMM domain-containing protein n=1 Tax=Nasonia vitripennis TaxID=7425 RepID=A0A7M7GDA0_NASVI|nr:COMM domain-containing protein 8-like [Nasonia vitripennis]XP_032453416.1 COMM domain-containing protein 8-like [Nasonia vitripennis]
MDNNHIMQCDLFHRDKLEELYKFLHRCIDEICNSTGPNFQHFKNVQWTKEEFNNVHKHISTFLHNPSCLYVDEEKMPLEYHEFPEHVQQAILTCLRVRKNQLTNALLYEYSSRHILTMLEFDWRLKYVMGSSKMASIREPLLQLDLILKEKQANQILELELNKDELDLVINAIETVIS